MEWQDQIAVYDRVRAASPTNGVILFITPEKANYSSCVIDAFALTFCRSISSVPLDTCACPLVRFLPESQPERIRLHSTGSQPSSCTYPGEEICIPENLPAGLRLYLHERENSLTLCCAVDAQSSFQTMSRGIRPSTGVYLSCSAAKRNHCCGLSVFCSLHPMFVSFRAPSMCWLAGSQGFRKCGQTVDG